VLDNTLCHSFICSATHSYALPLIRMLCCSFVRSATHSYAPLLIHMLCCSFVHPLLICMPAAHSYAPFHFCIHSYAPPSLRVRVCLRRSLVRVPCGLLTFMSTSTCLRPYASVGASSAPGPFRMSEETPVVRLHYPGTSLRANEPLGFVCTPASL